MMKLILNFSFFLVSSSVVLLSALPSSAFVPPLSNIVDSAIHFDNGLIAQDNGTFRVVRIYGNNNILVKSLSSGREFDVYYSSRIGADVGDLVTVTFDDDRWISIINNRTGRSAAVTSVSRK
ncbi:MULTISPECIES: hypothetical protein [Pseudanabaena]|uniref:Uncharacterized protein n=2 Tax=Pseudanabaena TaxID=1152 RepID=L8N6N1_9CYAN|nr:MULTISPECIES: hypothetical protein [Pseudanabaena]ELS33888.1 hypothetical protein Pse7429DRAFT_1112 [Pseudanabaena biceps PCC 7429]MDG3493914.1 hypothetical protein [Pseudanabaena catenata USMAC16]